MRSVLLNGQTSYIGYSQILRSNTFHKMLCEQIERAEKKKSSLLEFFKLFLKNVDVVEVDRRYDVEALKQLLLALTDNPIETIDSSAYYSFPKLGNNKELLVKFVEDLFDSWRKKQRFIISQDEYTSDSCEKTYKELVLVKTNEDLKNLVLRMHREILLNISDVRLKVLRQLPTGAQVGLLADKPDFKDKARVEQAPWLYELNYVWSYIFEPPVIFYTRSNKRRGLFKVLDKPILEKIDIEDKENWLVFPIRVCLKTIYVVVNKEYFALAAGLGNLFEPASFEILENRKPDGIYILGIDKKYFENEEDYNGVVYKEDDGTYVGMVGDDPSIDYFGYMKKMILTIHNLLVIDEGRLPIHGALARIKLKNGKKANVMLIGDSGAGKSETIEALNRLEDEVSEINILIDDMGSLDIINDEGKVVGYGTETGAFVRLDDLQPSYAYDNMDRSIFMNPNQSNARVIIPYSNYTEIIRPTDIDYFLYANNYEEITDESEAIKFFDNADEALEVFSKGARMAKGTTAEKGLTTSYFANPFGAVQRREKHEKIAEKFMTTMMSFGVKVGELKTQLGRDGYEQKGPLMAARSLLKLIASQE
ncbi:ATPase [Halothermothrix orenii]|uniref:ATPase n=1 Tax=Halothermothrix orenii (strain H 168 / OCM 544 / DSM 9562) TaxID=373903 RepID=B8D1H0_HALOH|nr:ATPase [Halothermothrix orenii]ACL69047.1 ATPase [Halothermothrix orenii H 168]